MKTSPRNAITGLVVLVVVMVLAWRISLPKTEEPTVVPPANTDGWATLSDPTVGISLRVPPQVNVFSSPDKIAGCNMPLVLGLPESNTIYLMSKYSSCNSDADDNSKVNAYLGDYTTKITVVPVANDDEATGFIKSALINNTILGAQEPSLNPIQDCQERQINTVRATISKEQAVGDKTVPVSITTNGCSIFPNILNVRYSPTHKKLVIFESVYSAAPAGVYRTTEDASNPYATVDQEIYKSVEVTR